MSGEERFTHSCFVLTGFLLGAAFGGLDRPAWWSVAAVFGLGLMVMVGRAIWDVLHERETTREDT
jgi:hypothetical protein